MPVSALISSSAVRVFRLFLATTLTASPLRSVGAQMAVALADSTQSPQTLFTRRDAFVAAAFAGATVAMFPLDKSVARRISNRQSSTNRFLDRSSKGVEVIADPGAIIIGSTLYLYGRFSNHPDIEDLGWHGTEAVILGSSITAVLKGVTGRARPYVTNDTNPHDFKFLKGFSGGGRTSFPSGHATAAFAAASAVTSETQRIWPGHTWLVAPAMYGGATLVGLSRMYHDKHWASDVVLGAAVGTFSGLKVVRYTHAHPENFLDRAVLGVRASPSPHGSQAEISVSFPN
jgi:membrane-associated phospholipid phosphatase